MSELFASIVRIVRVLLRKHHLRCEYSTARVRKPGGGRERERDRDVAFLFDAENLHVIHRGVHKLLVFTVGDDVCKWRTSGAAAAPAAVAPTNNRVIV